MHQIVQTNTRHTQIFTNVNSYSGFWRELTWFSQVIVECIVEIKILQLWWFSAYRCVRFSHYSCFHLVVVNIIEYCVESPIVLIYFGIRRISYVLLCKICGYCHNFDRNSWNSHWLLQFSGKKIPNLLGESFF